MEAKAEAKEYVCLNHSNGRVTYFSPQPKIPLADQSDHLKFMGCKKALEEANARDHVINSEYDDEDVNNDASTELQGKVDDDEGFIDDVFDEESVKKKLELLAKMAGVEYHSSNPGIVLSQVVRILKILERKRSTWYSNAPSQHKNVGFIGESKV